MSIHNMTSKVSHKVQSFCRSIQEELRSSTGRQQVANDQQDYENRSAKAAEKQRQQDEYMRLNMKDRVVHGMGGSMRIA
jgi:hypothetical protein